MSNSQAVQVHPSLHPSHLFQGSQVVRERCLQMKFLGALAVPGDQEALEAPDGKTKSATVNLELEMMKQTGCHKRNPLNMLNMI